MRPLRRRSIFYIAPLSVAFGAACLIFPLHSQNPNDFPAGFDALQAAPNSHRLLFENAFVRVLEVDLPKNGGVVPMHHHRWPSLVVNWDTGGDSAHIHYLRPGQPMRDVPSVKAPTHRGAWDIHWLEPEPMHSIELVSLPADAAAHAADPPELRIEIKNRP